MFSHVHIGVNGFETAFAFYSGLMQTLGYPLRFAEPENSFAGWMPKNAERPLLLIGRAFDGRPADPGNGQMVALLAPDRKTVRACHAWALTHGGFDEGSPGLRPQYHADYYGAYFRDPERNKLCICTHHPALEPKDGSA